MAQQNKEIWGHPRGLSLLFFTEMWERFSYYGMRAIFTLYMIKALLFSKEYASQIYGSYTGLVYLTPLIGGYVADRYWGNRRSILAGGSLMAIGQFLMFLSGSFYQNKELAVPLLWGGLAVLIIGNGFFKPNISSMVGQLYQAGDRRKDAAFTIFYMGINIGAFLSPLVCGALGDTGNPADFKWGFLAACAGMIIGTVLFLFDKDSYVVTPEGEPIGVTPNKAETSTSGGDAGLGPRQLLIGGAIAVISLLVFHFALDFDWIGSLIYAACVSMPIMIITDSSLTKVERDRIIVIYIAAFFVIFFWAAFEQAGASLTFFAEEQTQRVLNWHIPMWLAQVVSAVLLYLLFLGIRWTRRTFEKLDGLSSLLYLFLGGPFIFILYQNIAWLSSGTSVITYDEIPASYFQSVNAVAVVLLAPVIAALWVWMAKRKAEPSSPLKQAFGLMILAVGYFIISMAPGVKGGSSEKVSMLWLIGLYVIHTVGELCLSPIGLSLVSKLAPMRFVSLLFGVWFLSNAVANKAAGQLSALYPPSGAEYAMAAKNGIDDATYRGLLEGQIQPTPEQTAVAKEAGLPLSYPTFLGSKVTNLYQFFMIFVGLAGVAGLILFGLSFPLKKMMHGAD